MVKIALAILLAVTPAAARDFEENYFRRPMSPIEMTVQKYTDQAVDGAVRGDYIQRPTFMNIVGNLAVNFSPAAPLADSRDFTASFKKSWNSHFTEHKKEIAFAAAGFLPFIGESKKFKAAFEAGREARMARKAEQFMMDTLKFAPAIESGLSRKLQVAICKNLDAGEFIAVRRRVYAATFMDGKLPAKEVGDEVVRAYRNGVRELSDGRRVISDVDIAFVSKVYNTMTEHEVLDLGTKINLTYGNKVVTHGDNFNGARRGIEKAIAIEQDPNEIVYVFNKSGMVASGSYAEMARRYNVRN